MNNTPKHRQQWILEELKKSPLLSYGAIWGKYGATWGKGQTTFDKDWKQAQKELKDWQKTINEEVAKQVISAEVEERKKDLDALKILADIARGKGMRVDGKKFIPSYRERISAIAQLSKMEGWDAPVKQEVTGKDGKDLQPFQVTGIIIK